MAVAHLNCYFLLFYFPPSHYDLLGFFFLVVVEGVFVRFNHLSTTNVSILSSGNNNIIEAY